MYCIRWCVSQKIWHSGVCVLVLRWYVSIVVVVCVLVLWCCSCLSCMVVCDRTHLRSNHSWGSRWASLALETLRGEERRRAVRRWYTRFRRLWHRCRMTTTLCTHSLSSLSRVAGQTIFPSRSLRNTQTENPRAAIHIHVEYRLGLRETKHTSKHYRQTNTKKGSILCVPLLCCRFCLSYGWALWSGESCWSLRPWKTLKHTSRRYNQSTNQSTSDQ